MSTLRCRAAAEEGFVMVVTVVVMALALVITGVAISDTVNARHVTEKDRRAEAAQQAADAGLQIAMYRANQMNLGKADFNSGLSGLTNTLGCLVPTLDVNAYVSALTTVTLGASTSCPNQTGAGSGTPQWKPERLGNRTTFAYQFIPGGTSTGPSSTTGHVSLNPVIVSIGYEDGGTTSTSDDVIRRVEAILNPVDPFNMIEATGDLSFAGGLSTILNGDIRTNGNLTVGGLGLIGANVLAADGSILRLANAQYGGSFSGVLTVASKVHTTTPFTRTPVSISSTKVDCWNGSGAQGTAGACPSATYYNSSNHRLTVTSGQSVTLGGGDFVFCRVSVAAGGTLNTSLTASSPTRIFIDSPSSARCAPTAPGTASLNLSGNLNTINVTPSQLQIYIAGNGTPGGTTATINTSLLGGTPAFFLYAPDTDVTMTYTLFQGNIIGHDVSMNGYCTLGLFGLCLVPSATNVLTQDLGLYNMPLSASVGVFTRKQYVQCTGTEPVATDPTKDC
jgi:hypothetical protein